MVFLAASLWVPPGVAAVARLAQVPVYLIYASFDEKNRALLRGLPTLMPPDGRTNRLEWARCCMETLYRSLAAEVRQRPAQWEGLLYIHQDLVKQATPGHGGLLQYYMPFALHDRYFLLEKERMVAYPVSRSLYLKIWQRYFK